MTAFEEALDKYVEAQNALADFDRHIHMNPKAGDERRRLEARTVELRQALIDYAERTTA